MRRDPARAFLLPHLPFLRQVCRWVRPQPAARPRQIVRCLTPAALRRVLAGVAACAAVAAGQAWDAERMAGAARQLGPLAVQGAQALRPLLERAGAMDEPARVEAFNLFYNRRIQFRDDVVVWNQKDYWASPLETLGSGAGDCEDFAIAKYFSLVATGIPARRLRLVYVRAQVGGPGGVVQPHMVLAYYPAADSEPMILDNLVTEVRPASRRPDLAPLFSFNAEGLWQGVSGAAGGDAASRLSRWREVLVKARAEGFQGDERP